MHYSKCVCVGGGGKGDASMIVNVRVLKPVCVCKYGVFE